MAQTNGHAEVLSKSSTSRLATQLSTFDFGEPLMWDTPECLGQFHALVENPPLHSVVLHIEPAAAEQLLLVTNSKNRPLSRNFSQRMAHTISGEDYELTGDTLKFSRDGALLDGQHRLDACIRSKKPIITHAVFGLSESIFDVIDQGHKRSPGDILALAGISDYTMVAGAVAWILKLEGGFKGNSAPNLTARKIRQLATGSMKSVCDFTKDARLINSAFKHPPTLIAAILYMIGKHSPAVARDFAHDWVHGSRVGRNANFDVLAQRLHTVQSQAGGVMNRTVRAAMVIQTFNHWYADEVASARSITWKREWKFPSFEFNKDRFRKQKQDSVDADTSLTATQLRVLHALAEGSDGERRAQMSHSQIADSSNTPKGSVPYILSTLTEGGQIRLVAKGAGNTPPIYEVTVGS